MKAILLLIGVVFTCVTVYAKDLHEVLANSAPIEQGTCLVSTPKHGMMAMECIRGVRTDGAVLFAIRNEGEIIAVFEQVSKDVAPKQIWGIDWQTI